MVAPGNNADGGGGNVEVLASIRGQAPLSEPERFGILVVGAYAAICASALYTFNLFSGSLQQKYSFTQRDLSSINTVGMVFCFFLAPYGVICDYYGPKPLYVLASLLFSTGALLMGLTFADHIEGSTVRFCVYNAFLCLGGQLFDLASMVTLLSVFPTNRGGVVAIFKTMFGLGSAIIGAVYSGFFLGSPQNYFYFLIGLVVCIGGLSLRYISLPSYHLTGYEQKHLSEEEKEQRQIRKAVYLRQKAPTWRFIYILAIICVLVVYLPTQSLLVTYLKLGHTFWIFALLTMVITLLIPFAAIPWYRLDPGSTVRAETLQSENVAGDAVPVADGVEDLGDGNVISTRPDEEEIIKTDVDFIAPQYQTTFLESFRTLQLWSIFWTLFCTSGSSFVLTFNARFIMGSLVGERVDDDMGAVLTVINGTGSAVGRLLISAFEVWSQKRKAEDRIPITLCLFLQTVTITFSIVLFLVLPPNTILVAFVVAALGNGFCGGVSILIVRTIYAKDPALHYNFVFNGLWLSAIFFNRLLYGEWYGREAEKQGSELCYGQNCVQVPLLVLIGFNLSGLAANVYTHISYCRFSKMALEERRQLRCGTTTLTKAESCLN